MIYTIEPGIYIPENAEGVDPKFFNIGVRIEDDILITPEGHTILSGEAPREINEIESSDEEKRDRRRPGRVARDMPSFPSILPAEILMPPVSSLQSPVCFIVPSLFRGEHYNNFLCSSS